MDKLLTPPKFLQRTIAATLAILAVAIATWAGLHLYRLSDPYIRTVLAIEGDAQRGYEIFQINCAGCHGSQADGNVGPSLHNVPKRKSEIGLIHQVISGKTPPMPKFQPTAQEMADLLRYLENL